MVVALALLVAGCDVRWPERTQGSASVHGRTTLSRGGFPLAGAALTLDGPVRRQATTARNGAFALNALPEGRYQATLRALHGTYTASMWVRGNQVFNWRVDPIDYDRELFYELSGLKEYYVDDSGHLTWEYGQLVRWEKETLRVYIDVDGAPYQAQPTWPEAYWQELKRWESVLKGRLYFRRVHRAADADIVLMWQPHGFLGDHAGIARHLAYYENGSLKRVQIEIDVAYGDRLELWAHELAHGMGLGHVTDPYSVMYPWLDTGQRSTFSEREKRHVRLVYDVPSGQRLSWGYAAAAEHEEGDGESAVMPLSLQSMSGHRGHVTSLGGAHQRLDSRDVKSLINSIGTNGR